MEYKSCFILMPFTRANDLEREDLDYIYHHILRKTIEDFEIDGKKYFKRVERFENKVGSIISGIVNNLNSADLVIADLTGLNPNVMYELGVRHALKRGTIIISQDLNALPSDLRDYLTVGYTYSKRTTAQVSNFEAFKINLHNSMLEVVTTNKYDSPVLNYLQQKQRFRNEEEIERLKVNIIIVDAIYSEYDQIQELMDTLYKTDFENVDNLVLNQLINLKLSSLTTALNELKIPYTSSILYENIINAKTLLSEISKMFGMNEYFSSLKGLEGLPLHLLGNTVKDCFERNLVDVFELSEKNEFRFTNMNELFKKDGILQTELLDYLDEYLDAKAKEFGLEEPEIDKILTS